jgi:hypothetical protein
MFSQDFSYYYKTDNNTFKTNLTFENITSKEQADEIISQVYQINGVIDFYILFPESFKARIEMSELIDVEELITRMKSIGVKLTNESLNFDTK